MKTTLALLATGVFWLLPVTPAKFHVEAHHHCLAGPNCDSAVICIAGWNDTDGPMDASVAVEALSYYEPSDSLRRARPAYADSIAKTVVLVAIRDRDSEFVGRRVQLGPREAFRDTIRIHVEGSRFVHAPGSLNVSVEMWSGQPGSLWRDAHLIGSTRVSIRVPRGL